MDQENTMVQNEGYEAEDSLPEGLMYEPQDDSVTLEEALEADNEQAEDNSAKAEDKPAKSQSAGELKEPGYVQSRISKATRELREELEALKAQLEPLREYQVTAEAQELVRTGKVKDLDTARELVRYRQGLGSEPKAADSSSQPRNDRGQFESKADVETQTRISMLQHQADRIKDAGGPDVIAAFKNDKEVKEKLISGEWDFYDVADHLRKAGNKKRTPSPMRSPNGASSMEGINALASMSDEQFAKLEKQIKSGRSITQR